MVTRNVNPVEGGPGGGQLEAKVAAYYLLAMLCECEPRGMPGAVACSIKFQRGYEGHALDDIVIIGTDPAQGERVLEIQAKRTLDFTASDTSYAKLVRQIVTAGNTDAELAAAIGRTSAKIERHYHQLLALARKMSSGAALRSALDADRVTSQGMRDFAEATASQMRAVGGEANDEALWRVLRRLQILVFDFESPGAVSTALAHALTHLVLPPDQRHRANDLWHALVTKALSYDADGGELTRSELVGWLTQQGLVLQATNKFALASRRFADASEAAIAVIDDSVGGVRLERAEHADAIAAALERARFVEIAGESGTGKSALLKHLAEEQRREARPLFLAPGRIVPGGWLTLSAQLGFDESACDFLGELAARGGGLVFIDGLDRVTGAEAQATVSDLLVAAAKLPMVRVIASVGPDFTDEQRTWLPDAALALLGTERVKLGTLSEGETDELADADPRLAQLIANVDAQPLTRNLFQLRQLLARADPALPASEAALARSWWEHGSTLNRVRHRDRLKALRDLAQQAIGQASVLDIAALDSSVTEDLVTGDVLVETLAGAKAVFRHDVLRDWSIANRLREELDLRTRLPLGALAPATLSRALELYARMLIEGASGPSAWQELLNWTSAAGAHGSWRRAVLLALVRSEQGIDLLERARSVLVADAGEALRDLVRLTEATESQSAVERLVVAGVDRAAIPRDLRVPSNLSWLRLMVWLLPSVDTLGVPVGRDVLHFFSSWLLANFGRDELSPHIVRKLYHWLCFFESESKDKTADVVAPLFTTGRRSGGRSSVVQELRTTFLMFADRVPAEAEAYLRTHTANRQRSHVIEDILKFSQATAKAAPKAMAAFVVEVLIEEERRDDTWCGARFGRRLSRSHRCFFPPAPTRGPFLALLRSSPEIGLGLIRELLHYGLALDTRSNREPPDEIAVTFASGPRRFPLPGSYFLSRESAGADVMSCALRALEGWAHEQVEGGRPAIEVAEQIIEGERVPAALLAVAVDVLLSHVPPSDAALAPFIASPELLALDWERFTRDRVGIDRLGQEDGANGLTRPSNADLEAQGSRRTALMWCAGEYLFGAAPELVEEIRAALRAERARHDAAAGDRPITTRDPRWQADQALRRLDRANWRNVVLEREDGTKFQGREYVAPPAEQAIIAPLSEQSVAEASNFVLVHQIVEALLDPGKRDAALIARAVAWARAQPLDDLGTREDDFERAKHQRAMIAAAALVHLVPGYEGDLDWCRAVLERVLDEVEAGANHPETGQLRYSARGLATLGWIAIATGRDAAALPRLLALAGHEDRALTSAFITSLPDLAAHDERLPKALLRLALAASIHPERDWKNEGAYAARQEERRARLDACCAAEEAWLAGGAEPDWPCLPPSRRYLDRFGGGSLVDDELDEPKMEPTEWFNHQHAGVWLAGYERCPATNGADWWPGFVFAYQPWAQHAWGADLARDAEISELPTEWLNPFESLKLRLSAKADRATFTSRIVDPLVALPDHSFLAAIEALIFAADCLFWNDNRLSIELLVLFRERAIERLQQCWAWQWRTDEVTDTIGTDIACALRVLHFHEPLVFGPANCYLPAAASGFQPVIGRLAQLTLGAPGLAFVAGLFLTVCERASDWIEVEPLLLAAEAWLKKRSHDADFWRDHGFGTRLCVWLTAKLEREALDDTTIERVRAIVDQLARNGVPEALTLEAHLAISGSRDSGGGGYRPADRD